jgi:hypothetical protein
LLENDRAKDLGRGGAVSGGNVCGIMYAIAVKPGPVGDVEAVEETGSEPVGEDREDDG